MKTISDETKLLFLAYAKDAGNWSGTPLVGGNVPSNQRTNGQLTHLKKAGYLKTEKPNVRGERHLRWIHFTPAGVALAAELGVTLNEG